MLNEELGENLLPSSFLMIIVLVVWVTWVPISSFLPNAFQLIRRRTSE